MRPTRLRIQRLSDEAIRGADDDINVIGLKQISLLDDVMRPIFNGVGSPSETFISNPLLSIDVDHTFHCTRHAGPCNTALLKYFWPRTKKRSNGKNFPRGPKTYSGGPPRAIFSPRGPNVPIYHVLPISRGPSRAIFFRPRAPI